jgi:hypothetical protein
VIEAHRFGGRRSDFFTSGKLASGNLRLFQQHRPVAVISQGELLHCSTMMGSLGSSNASMRLRKLPRLNATTGVRINLAPSDLTAFNGEVLFNGTAQLGRHAPAA